MIGSAPLAVSFIGALQASLSVLLTLAYGLIAARFGLIRESSAKDVSKLCVKMFLPMLIVTNVGKHITADSLGTYYLPIMLWSLVYTLLSIGYGAIFVKFFKFPSWTAPACSFNNTTSLPLLLVQSLAVTGLLDTIARGNVDDAVERSKSYFLINSMLSNGLTFALGPKLLSDDNNEDGEENERRRRRGSVYSENTHPEVIEDEESGHGDGDDGETNETTHLIPTKYRKPVTSVFDRISTRYMNWFQTLPNLVQTPLSLFASMVNAPFIGAALALFIGLIPPLQRAMFNQMEDGGWLKAWFTSSLKNAGELFTALQMFVVGIKLSSSIEAEKDDSDNEDTKVPKRSLAIIYLLRFILWPVISIASIYFLAKKKLLSDDPVLWFSMMLMPCGPPAIILASLVELEGKANTKLQVAKLLMISYAISPVVCFTVVGALRTSEAIDAGMS